MASEPTNGNSPNPKLAAIEELYGRIDLGYSAEVVIKALDPIMERRLGILLDKFQTCPPELGPLLDLKAQISEVWRIRRELLEAKKKGANATKTLQAIIETEQKVLFKEKPQT